MESRSLPIPVRIAAAIFGVFLGCGGVLLVADEVDGKWELYMGVAALFLGFLLVRAALTGRIPSWPD